MKTLVEFLNKTYDQKLENHKEYKKTLKEMKNFLTENKVTCSKSDDIDCIHYEIYVSSIKNKQHFEEVFFDTYVKMYDYWYDLTYKERKQQMNVDIDACKQDMKHFMYEEEEIFMPCFDSRMNHLYNTEIVLLDLKQYHTFIRDFEKEIKDDLYGVLPYENGFTSTQVYAQMGDSFVVYQPMVHRFYCFLHGHYTSCLSLDPKMQNIDEKELRMAAMLFLLGREEDLAQMLIESTLIPDKMKKKISKLLEKQAKRNKNNT